MTSTKGTSNNDNLLGNTVVSNLIEGLEGDDFIFGGSLADSLYGDQGSDTVVGADGDDLLFGGADNDSLYGGNGNDTIDGGEGDDLHNGGQGDDCIYGQAGNDVIVGDDGNEFVDGGDGNDTIFGDNGKDIIDGSNGSDQIFGGADNDSLYGGNNNDTLDGGTGDDFLQGGFGDDQLNGQAGNDVLVGDEGLDFLDGGQGNDTLYGDNGKDTIVGGDGNDVIFGGNDDDALYGGNDNDVLVGDNGNDFLQGGFGDDSLYGGNDNDILDGDEGNDYLQGGLGDDNILGGAGQDFLIGDEGNDFMQGGAGQDTMFGDNGSDTLVGDDGNDLINGGAGKDSLYGGNDNDTINGGDDNDFIHGGDGNDVINGGNGDDTLTGGSGKDEFLFESGVKFNPAIGVDRITDFNIGEGDFIHLSKTTFTGLTSFNGQSFSNPADFAVVTSTAAAESSSAVIIYNSTTGELFYNTNGSAPGFGEGGKFALLDGAPPLTANNFSICDAGDNPDPNPKPTVISIGDSSVVEGQNEIFDVKLSAPTTSDTKVNLSLSDVTAVLNSDYKDNFEVSFDGGTTWTPSGAQVTVPKDVKDFKVRLGTIDDTAVENPETFKISANVDGTTPTVVGTGTIIDNDKLAEPTVIQVGNSSVIEGGKEIFDVTLSSAATPATKVKLEVFNDDAQLGADYTDDLEVSFDGGTTWQPAVKTGSEIAVAPGSTTFKVRLSTLEDATVEPNETFRLTATTPANGNSAFGVGTILDNDKLSLSIGNSSVLEGTKEVFDVKLSNPVSKDTKVNLSLADESAILNSDYDNKFEVSFDNGVTWSPTGPQVTVAAGKTDFKVRLGTIEDTTVEPTETFKINGNIDGTNINATGTGTIIDNDKLNISIGNSSVVEGQKEVFDVQLSNPVSSGTKVNLTLANETAVLDQDYKNNFEVSFDNGATWTPSGPQVTVGANVTNFKVRLDTVQDNSVEPTETFKITAAIDGTTINATGTGTIIDDDKLSISIGNSSVVEGQKEVFDVKLSNPVAGGSKVNLTLANETAVLDQDYNNVFEVSFDNGATWSPSGSQVTVGANVTDFKVRLGTLEDNVVEPNETFKITANVDGTTISATGTGTITDNDKLSISIGNSTVVEGQKEVFDVKLSNPVAGGSKVNLTLANETAVLGQDYNNVFEVSFDNGATWSPSGSQVTVGANVTDFKVRLDTLEDNVVEPNETFKITANVDGTTISATGTGTITDNDKLSISIGNSTAVEGQKEVFDVKLSNPVAGGSKVNLTLANETAVLGQDYNNVFEVSFDNGATWSPSGSQVTVGANVTDFKVRLGTLEDNVVEPNETFKITANVDGTTISATGTGTITDNDQLNISIGNSSVVEGQKEVFDVQLSNPVSSGTKVNLTLANETAVLDQDYKNNFEVSFDNGATWTPSGSQVTVGANVTNFKVRLDTVQDNSVEPTETFKITAAIDGTTISATGTGTIIDDDKLSISIGNSTAVEGQKEVFDVKLSNPVAGGSKVNLTLANETAVLGQDYNNVFEVSFDNGVTWSPSGSQVAVGANVTDFKVRLGTLEDNVVEPNETFKITANVDGTTISATGTGTITDNDKLSISIGNATAVEGQKEVFDVKLSNPVAGGSKVNLTLANETAVLGQDYNNVFEVSFDNGVTWSPSGSQVTVGANVTDFKVRLGTLEDNVVEPNETFKITANVDGTTTSATGTGTITDNDQLKIAIGNATAVEGQKEVFDVQLSNPVAGGTKVSLSLQNVTAVLGQDYNNVFEVSFDNGATWSPSGADVTVGENVTNFKVRLGTIEDTLVEGTEKFTIQATASANGNTVSATGTGIIIDNDTFKSKIVGADCIVEGTSGAYRIQLDQASDQDRIFTVQINDGSAKRYDGDGSNQDIMSGGAFDIAAQGVVFKDRLPNNLNNGWDNRPTTGPGDATWDYTVFDSKGVLNKGNTIQVKVAAGKTVSDDFSVNAWKEKVTVDNDYQGPKYTGTAVEGTETFSLKIVDGAGTTVTKDTADVCITDATHYSYVSPIVIDLNGDGVKTLSVDKGVQFDMLNTGSKVTTGWISGQDGFLAVDANGNGQIDNRDELFGGGVGEGFAELATFDSNHDGIVNASDSLFGSLSIWQDVNENGTTDAGELQALSAHGISSLNTAYTNEFTADAQGNILGEHGSAITNTGKSLDMIDVYFKVQ